MSNTHKENLVIAATDYFPLVMYAVLVIRLDVAGHQLGAVTVLRTPMEPQARNTFRMMRHTSRTRRVAMLEYKANGTVTSLARFELVDGRVYQSEVPLDVTGVSAPHLAPV